MCIRDRSDTRHLGHPRQICLIRMMLNHFITSRTRFPMHIEKVFKDELLCLVAIGVLSKCGPSEYLSPTFIIPKKDGRVQWVSDFRTLKLLIKRQVYTIPRIQDILRKRSGYQFLRNSIFRCSITRSNSMNTAKTFVSSARLLATFVTIAYQ